MGYHRDTFSDRSGDKIENKILLVARDRSNLGSKNALGRGGAGPGLFVFALLDWRQSTRARRRRWIRIGGDAHLRVTQRMIDEFCIARNLPVWRYDEADNNSD